MIAIAYFDSPFGRMPLAARDTALVGLWLPGQKYEFGSLRGETAVNESHPILLRTKEWLRLYFAGKQPSPNALPLAPEGSPFRQAVWRLLLEIPYGETVTYGALAARFHAPQTSARAVGGAVAHNPISIIIPCHRVVGAGGNLTGYAGGIAHKIALLTLEGVELSRFSVPKSGTAL